MCVSLYSNLKQNQSGMHHQYLLWFFSGKDLCLQPLESFLELLCNFIFPVLAKGKKVLPPSAPPLNSELMSTWQGTFVIFFLLKIWNHSKEGLRSKKGHLLISWGEGRLSFLNVITWKHQINVNRGNYVRSWCDFFLVQTLKSIFDIISWRYSGNKWKYMLGWLIQENVNIFCNLWHRRSIDKEREMCWNML